MANCKCCGKSLGIMGGERLNKDLPGDVCKDCYSKIIRLKPNAIDRENVLASALDLIDGHGFSEEGKQLLFSYVNLRLKAIMFYENEAKQKERATKIKEAEASVSDKDIDIHMITSGFSFDGYFITDYLGIASGEIALGTSFVADFTASFADFFGTESKAFSGRLNDAKQSALRKMIVRSIALGGNAIIGVDFDYVTFSQNLIGVIANGTSVIVSKT